MMKMRIGVVFAAVVAAVQTAFAIDPSGIDLTVEKGSPTTIDSAVTYDSVTLHDNLTVDGATVQLSDNAGKDLVLIASEPGEDVTLRLTNGGRWVQAAGKCGHVKIGSASNGGFGRIIVEGAGAGSANDTFRMRDIIVDSGAAVPQDEGHGENTVLYLGPGATFWTHGILNQRKNSSIRIQFAGGGLNSTDGGGAQWFSNLNGGNCTTVIESVSQATMLFNNQGHSAKDLTNGKGTFIFEGAGNIQFTPGNNNNTKIYGSAENYDWSNFSGNMVLAYKGSRLLVTGVNVLPCGAKPGILMSAAAAVMDIQANNAINGVETSGSIVNEASGTSVATLTVGQYKDSSIKASEVSSRIAFRQVGHTIALTVAEVPSYELVGGTLKIAADTAFGALSLAAGSTLVIDGCRVTVDLAGYSDSGATITCLNGGSFEILCDADSDAGAYISAPRGFKKTGSGTFTANARMAITNGLLHVAEGGLVLSGIGTMNEWWRVTITSAYTGWYTMVSCLGFFLEGEHQPVTDGMTFTYAGADVAADALTAGQTTFSTATAKYWGSGTVSQPSNGHSTKWAESTEVLLSSSGESACTFQTSSGQGISASNPAIVTFRMAQKVPVSGFSARVPWNSNDAAHLGRHISNWIVDTSADGVTWETVLDMRTRSPNPPALVDETDVWGRWYGGNGVTEEVTDKTSPDFEKCLKPYELNIAAGEKVLKAKGFGPNVTVRVDRGALLDCTMVEGRQEISKLEVDLSEGTGVGTLKGVKLAESGTLNLLGAGSFVSVELPLAFEESETTGNLSGWTVTVDGKQVNRFLVWTNGRLNVRAPGMLLMFK